jgi:hypothetical protein
MRALFIFEFLTKKETENARGRKTDHRFLDILSSDYPKNILMRIFKKAQTFLDMLIWMF